MITGTITTSHLAVDTSIQKLGRKFRAEENVIYPRPCVARPGLPGR